MPGIEQHESPGLIGAAIGQHLIHIGLRHPESGLPSLELLPLGVDDDIAVHDDVRAEGEQALPIAFEGKTLRRMQDA